MIITHCDLEIQYHDYSVPHFDSILNLEFKPRQGARAWHVRLQEV